MQNVIENEFKAHLEIIQKVMQTMVTPLEQASKLIVDTLKNKNKILFFGNGGSAADAQHLAAELTGRYKTNRQALAAIALTTDTSALTAIGNDYGFSRIFDRQVEALVQKGDLLFGISTSGNSENVINALKLGQTLGCKTIGLSGRDGGAMNDYCDINLIVPSNDTPRIQEMHILFGHTICQIIDDHLSQ